MDYVEPKRDPETGLYPSEPDYDGVILRGGLSHGFENIMGELWGWDPDRNDPVLIRVVEELGKEADGPHAQLRVVEIPDDVDWYVHDYDGQESVHEKHRSW